MRTTNFIRNTFTLVAVLLLAFRFGSPTIQAKMQTNGKAPVRSSTPIYQGDRGNQKTEIYFDPATDLVTVKMPVQDPSGYFVPSIHRDNFVVYENEVRQQNVTVDIEHAPITLSVLMEWGGRYQAMAKALGDEVPRAARQALDAIGRQDKVAIYRYGDHVDQIADFSASHEALDELLVGLTKPEFSELNFYDALISTIESMKKIEGRRAILVISSGVDTFSKARYEDALTAAREGGIPIYAISIGPDVRRLLEQPSFKVGPYARADWDQAQNALQQIATSSGGRLYYSTLEMSGIYDDLMENLRVRYVITYKSTSGGDRNTARTVRVELVNPATGGPLEIVDANGKPVRSKLSFEYRYVPATASVAVSHTLPPARDERVR